MLVSVTVLFGMYRLVKSHRILGSASGREVRVVMLVVLTMLVSLYVMGRRSARILWRVLQARLDMLLRMNWLSHKLAFLQMSTWHHIRPQHWVYRLITGFTTVSRVALSQ